MAGIFDDLPGARTEAVPGPDGYSGCGLEKASAKLELGEAGTPDWTYLLFDLARCQHERAQQLYEQCYEVLRKETDRQESEYAGPRDKAFTKLRLRSTFELSKMQWVQVHSSQPLSDDDMLSLARKLKEQVGRTGNGRGQHESRAVPTE
jgi:hypothetical protein